MKALLTVIPGVVLAMALVTSAPAAAATHETSARLIEGAHVEHAALNGSNVSVIPVADAHHGAAASAVRGDRDRDFDHGFRGGFVGGAFYNPFWYGYGWGPAWGYWAPFYGYNPGYYAYSYDGGLKLKVTGPNPKNADVYADGAYVGTVDDFNGTFQKLTLGPGPHTVQVRARGYRPLTVKVRIQPDRTVTYRAEMRPVS